MRQQVASSPKSSPKVATALAVLGKGNRMKPTKEEIRRAIDSYFMQSLDGLDVTAFVLDRIGRDEMERDAKTTHRSMEQAKQEMGKLISQELLRQMFWDVEVLDSVKVDPTIWPGLAGWVATYTQHRVGRRR